MRQPGLRVAFRADASLDIGSGHVMRCLTLAEALREGGAECRFIGRELPGNLLGRVAARGFAVNTLPAPGPEPGPPGSAHFPPTPHAAWLGVPAGRDADETRSALAGPPVDWLVVDHYALDASWEAAVRPVCRQLMVIDDLADRRHACDLLLDQNLGRQADDYRPWLPEACRILAGPTYALLRPEFAAWRARSLQRRRDTEGLHLLISLGGVDRDNHTGRILEALRPDMLPGDARITVILGATAPWQSAVRTRAASLPWPCTVVVDATDMAERLSQADLAIGAAGSSAWERCCLGLPTLPVVLAANQRGIAAALQAHTGIAPLGDDLADGLERFLGVYANPGARLEQSMRCAALVDGTGCRRVAEILRTNGGPS